MEMILHINLSIYMIEILAVGFALVTTSCYHVRQVVAGRGQDVVVQHVHGQ